MAMKAASRACDELPMNWRCRFRAAAGDVRVLLFCDATFAVY
jgi:hypothetical protein